jgi:DNA-binding HxlR family transcriptional regulator
MMGRSADYSKEKCAIAASLDIVGEPWTLLIIRDAFSGLCRFEQWQEALGLARNVLASRLKHLVAHGVFEQRLYCERPRRYEYLLTEKGCELRPMILFMQDWGQKHVYGEEKSIVDVIHTCGHSLSPVTHCAHCEQRVRMADLDVQQNPDAISLAELGKRRFVAEEVE